MRRAPAAALLLVAVLAAACGSTSPSSGAGSTPSASAEAANSASASAAVVTAKPSGTKAPASSAPSKTPVPSGDASPSADTSSAPPTDSATPSQPSPSASHAALACQPEGTSKTFWTATAQQVSWDVYCAVLPKGWQVGGGSFRLAGGGWMKISYNGPGGASLSLSEGNFCTDGSGCVPSGSDAGGAAFGGMSGTLVTTDAGGYAIVVGRGSTPSWLMVTSGLDQATTVSLGAALARVSG